MNLLNKIKTNWKSGLTISLISIPLSISLAVASNINPTLGIITAFWAGLMASIFGSSNYNIIGPTGALSGIIASFVIINGSQMVSMLAVLSGLFILIAYFLRLEKYLIFIPSSVIHGFTLGVAVIIALNQLNFIFGLKNLHKHENFILNVIETFRNINFISWQAFGIFSLFFIFLILLKKISTIPSVIIVAPLGILLGYLIDINIFSLNLETLGSRYGSVGVNFFSFPDLVFNYSLFMTAIIIALISILETMLSAKIADTMTKTKHNDHKEMLGLSIANIASGFFGGIPATAALARTSYNIKNGATDKMSATISSIFIALISILMLSYFKYLPMAVIAAILVNVAVGMIEREHFIRLWRHDKASFFIAISTAIITVCDDPIIGILVGSMIALLVLVNRLSTGHYELMTTHFDLEYPKDSSHLSHEQKDEILVYSFKGKLVYINNQEHKMRFEDDFAHYSIIILKLQDVYFIDLDGIDALDEIIELILKRNQKLLIIGASPYIKSLLTNTSRYFRQLEDKGLLFANLNQALRYLKNI